MNRVYYETPVQAVKRKMRHTLREMLLCGVLVTLVIVVIYSPQSFSHLDGGTIFALLVFVLVASFPAWAIYRLTRFLVGR